MHFINLCNIVCPPRSGLFLGLSMLAFVTMKVEQILAGEVAETDEEKNRVVLKERKVEVAKWLTTSTTFKFDPHTGVISTHQLMGDNDAEDEAEGTLD